jgi:hypothetical protein
MKDALLKKILGHPDEDEIISKLVLGDSPHSVHEWLKSKYAPVSQTQFIVTEANLKKFESDYLDLYQHLKKDMILVKANAQREIELSIKKNPSYKEQVRKLVNNELDLRETICNLVVAVETRVGVVFDKIQENFINNGLNTREERLFMDYARVLGEVLEKYHKFTEVKDSTTINNTVTFQVMDQHVAIIQDVIKEILEEMDVEMSLKFMEKFNERFGRLRPPSQEPFQSVESRAIEGKLLTDNMSKKLDEIK